MADSLYLPQMDYTSRDYTAIRDDLKALIPNFAPKWTSRESTDFGIVLLELFAYLGDLLNYQIDRSANEAFISTATQRDTVLNLAKLLGYFPNDINPAAGAVSFTNSGGTGVSIPAGTKVYSSGNSPTTYTVDTTFTATANATTSANVTQGITVAGEVVGTSTGKANQEFALLNTGVIPGSLSSNILYVYVNGIAYTRIASIIDAAASDLSFYNYTDGNGITYIGFGDGVSGNIPPNGAQITVTYRYSDVTGSQGNIEAGSITTMDLTAISNAPITVSNSAGFSGGSDIESTDSIRINAPLAFRSVSRAVSLKDYETLALTYASIAKAAAVATSYGNVALFVAGTNGVTPSTSTLSSLKTWFADKIPPGTTVTTNGYTAAYPYLNVTVSVLPQYNAANVKAQVVSALASLFAFANVTFNDLIGEGDIFSACKAVTGVNYIVINDYEKLGVSPATTGVYSQTAVTTGTANTVGVTQVVVTSTNGLFKGATINSPTQLATQTVVSIDSATSFTVSTGVATSTIASGTSITIQGSSGTLAGERDFNCNYNEIPTYEASYITVNTTGGS